MIKFVDYIEIRIVSNPVNILCYIFAYTSSCSISGWGSGSFTPKEISQETDIKKGSIGTVLSRLEDRELVRHKGKYWAIIEDDRLASFTAMT
jgi:membrane protein implicated in regulation of membrane protease activity